MSWSGLRSDIVASVMLVSPCYCYVSLILLMWRIGFGVTGLELCLVDSDSSGLRPVDIIPKSKDRFMEWPPMKTIQPWAYMGTAWCIMWQNLVWHTNWWCGLSRLSWDPSGWEWVGKGVDSPENHMAQEGALGDLDWHLWWNLSGYAANAAN